MDFFDPSEMMEAKRTMDHYKEWAGEISSSYLNCGTPPTETLVKIAQTEDLKPHQVQLLAGEANKMIHAHKYANMQEKYFAADFPLADAKQAISCLQHDTVKVASTFSEPKIPDEGPTPFDMFGVTLPEIDKTASVKHDLKVMLEKVAHFQDMASTQLIIASSKLQSNEHAFIKEARQFTLDDSNSSERMKTISGLGQFVKAAKLETTGNRLLAKLAYVLGKEGKLEPQHAKQALDYFTKKADQKAPESLISDTLPCQIVNGQHPLYISLKTIADNEAEVARWSRDSLIADDKVKILKQKIRAL